MARMRAEIWREVLERPHNGVLASLRRDGRPYTIPLWFLWDGDVPDDAHPVRNPPSGRLWLTGTLSRVWCKQLMADPRMSFCIEDAGPPAKHIEVDGTAEALTLPDFDIWPISRRLAEKYVGRGDPANTDAVDAFFANMQTEPRMLFRVTPQVWRAIDLTVYRGKRADREFQAEQPSSDQRTQRRQVESRTVR